MPKKKKENRLKKIQKRVARYRRGWKQIYDVRTRVKSTPHVNLERFLLDKCVEDLEKSLGGE